MTRRVLSPDKVPDVLGLGLSEENRQAVVEGVDKQQDERAGRPVFGTRPSPAHQPEEPFVTTASAVYGLGTATGAPLSAEPFQSLGVVGLFR